MKQTQLKSKTRLQGGGVLNRGTSSLKATKRLGVNRSSITRLPNGEVIWSVNEADRRFSRFIIKRDGRCACCGSNEDLTNSHFFGRSHKATRFIPENCITLCVICHSAWEVMKKGDGVYRLFMINWLGEDNLDDLTKLSESELNINDAIKSCMHLLKDETYLSEGIEF